MLDIVKSMISNWFGSGMEMSYSRINAYRTCPWKYKLLYREGMRLPPTPFISLGLSIHRTLEQFHLRKGSSFDDMLECYNNAWVNEGFLSPQQVQDFFEKGQRMLENYWDTNKDAVSEILFLEKDFNFPLGANRLRGIIDRIDRHSDGTYEVIDYKTHAELWSTAKVDSDLQLSLYALACEKALGFVPATLTYYFLAHNKKVSTKRSKEQLEEAVALVEDIAGRIMKDDFKPNLNGCYKCDFKNNCPHSPKKIKG